jgi:UDP-glucose 4-epimerase
MIAVTGSAGFIGSHLVHDLVSRHGDRVRVLRRQNPMSDSEDGRLEVVRGDLASVADCERFVRGAKVIYHLAHRNVPLNSDENQVEDALVNLIPTLNLIQAIQRLGTCPHVVYFSSGGAVYGPNARRVPFRETDPCHPSCSYGIQKLAAEHYLRIAAQSGYLTATVLRVGNAYGTLLSPRRNQGLIGIALKNVLEGRPVRIFGNLKNVRDYVHLRDVGDMAEHVRTPLAPFDIFNVGSGQGYSVAEVLKTMEQVYQSPIQVSFDDTQASRLTDWTVLDTTKAKETFGWTTNVSLISGIQQMIAGWTNEVRYSSALA